MKNLDAMVGATSQWSNAKRGAQQMHRHRTAQGGLVEQRHSFQLLAQRAARARAIYMRPPSAGHLQKAL